MKNSVDYRHLKIIALITMTIDHIGAVLFPEIEVFRIVGRISFPIFLFMIVNSYTYTSDKMVFMKRLTVFTYASTVPFYLAFHQPFDIGFTYLLVLSAIGGMDLIDKSYKEKGSIDIRGILLAVMPVLYSSILGKNLSYGWFAICMGILIYYRDYVGLYPCIVLSVLLVYTYGLFDRTQITPLLMSVPVFWLLFVYDKTLSYKKQTTLQKYFYYIYYPIHLIFLVIIKEALS